MPKKKFDKTGPVIKTEDDEPARSTVNDGDSTDANTAPKKETEWKAPKFGVHPFYIGIDNSEISGAKAGTFEGGNTTRAGRPARGGGLPLPVGPHDH